MRTPEFWKRSDGPARMLAPLGRLYGMSVALKARLASPYRANARVICVGNLTAGGSGKTPVALAVGAALVQGGHKVFFLTRGYGGRERGPAQVIPAHSAAEMGDEALLLAQVAPTIVARDRAEGAALAVARGAEIIVMDDGHQNFTLAKDFSLVVVDGFGNGRMIPAGPLREPVTQGLSRTDAVVVMNDGMPDLEGYAGPVLRARLTAEPGTLAGRRVFAFAGIGRPEKFLASLAEAGATVMGKEFFPDHHPYRDDEIAALRTRAQGSLLITTRKDFVRLSPAQRAGVAVLDVAVTFESPIAFTALLDKAAGVPKR